MTQHGNARPGARAHLAAAQPASARPAPAGRARRRVATGTGASLVLAVASVAVGGAAQADDTYVVRTGDTVGHIASRTGASIAAIARANNLANVAKIRIGQQLTIPTVGAPAAPAAAPAAAAARHTVASGDTVSHVAARYGTSVAAIVAANGLDSRAFIRVGQQLSIGGAPGATAVAVSRPVTAATPTTATYRVVSGDTVSGIAARHGTSVAAISGANALGARSLIRIGQQLNIPGATASAPKTPLVGNTFAGRTYPEAVVASANLNKATLLSLGVPTKAQMQAKIVTIARAMGVDPALAQAIAFQESGFNHTAVSPANAIGTMQVIPSSGEWASLLVGRHLNLLDPDDNVTAGVAMLRQLVRTSVDLPTAIASYYQGSSSVRRNGMFADTRVYVANIQTHMVRFR